MSDGGSRHSRQQRRHLAGRVTFGKRFDAAIAGMADRVLRLGGGRYRWRRTQFAPSFDSTPSAKSIGASVAILTSSAIRYSGICR